MGRLRRIDTGELRRCLDGRFNPVEVDDLHCVRGVGQHEEAVGLRGPAQENQSTSRLSGAIAGVNDHMNARAVRERQLA